MAEGATVGDAANGARVERVELHPEYERYWLRLANGTLLPAEVTTAAPGHEGLCVAGGVALYPRDDLAQGPLPEGYGAVVASLCPALLARPPELRARGATGDVPVSAAGGVHLGVLSAAVALLGVALLALLLGPARRAWTRLSAAERAEAGVVLGVGVAARILFAPLGIFNGGGAAYEKIRFAWAVVEHAPYGEGYGAVFGPVLAAWGRDPEHLFLLNRGLSALAPPLLWALVRGTTPGVLGRRAALAAGLGLALLPLAVGISGSEAMHVSIGTLGLLALAAAPAGGLAAALVAGLAGGLVGHIRPEAIPLGALPLLWLWAPDGRRWPARLAGGVLLLVLLGWAALGIDRGQDVLRAERLGEPLAWLGVARPRFGPVRAEAAFSVFGHGGLTPVVLWPLALLGLGFVPPTWRWRLAAAWLATEAPFLQKVFPIADAWRLQLTAQPFWLVLCGFGAGGVGAWAARRLGRPTVGAAAPWAVGAVLAARLALVSPDPDWAHHREFDFLRAVAPTVPAEAVVWVVEEHARVEAFTAVMHTLGPARWRPLSQRAPGPAQGDERLWFGLGCLTDDEPCTRARERCALGPGETTRLGPPADLDLPVPVEGQIVGLYRLEACSP